MHRDLVDGQRHGHEGIDSASAVAAAETYVDKQMTAADLIAVVSLSNSLNVNLEFTEDRAALKKSRMTAESALGLMSFWGVIVSRP